MMMNTPEYEDLRKLILELQAQTHMLCGEGYTVFNGMTDEFKEGYLCGLTSSVDRVKYLLDRLKPGAE